MRLLSAGVLFVAATIPVLHGEEMTVSFSSAANSYLERRGAQENPKPESYVVMQGQYQSGRIVDPALEKMPFKTIVRSLVPHLRKRSYFPARTFNRADLLLVVHWGCTIGRDRNYEMENRSYENSRQLAIDYGNIKAAEPPVLPSSDIPFTGETGSNELPSNSTWAVNAQFDFETLQASTDQLGAAMQGKSVASMLGFNHGLQRDRDRAFTSEDTRTLRAMLEEDRYFLVIIAYDLAVLRTEKKLVQLWASRMSIRSAGTNFPTAVQRMGFAGADSFGTSQTDLTFTKAKKYRNTEVTIGDPVIIGYDEPEPVTSKAETPNK